MAEPLPRAFDPFGWDHLAVLGITAALVAGLIIGRRRLHGADDHRLRQGMGGLLAGNELLSWIVALAQGRARVPLQLCDVALVLTIVALLTLRRPIAELAYFWVLAGSLQAVLTPDLREAFPSYWWMKFFTGHCGMVLSVVYLAVTGRMHPSGRSVWSAWGWLNAYVLLAGLINWAAGSNLGYLARKPSQPSLLDYFGPWPYYILVMEAAALASFALYYAPFALARRR